MIRAWLTVALLLTGMAPLARAQGTPEVPVYPGAKLVLEKEQGEELTCCAFSTGDAAAKVWAWYATKLEGKPLTLQELAARYPALAPQFSQLQKALPPQVQYRAFVLREVQMNGKKGAELLEVMGAPQQGTGFSLTMEQLGASGARWGYEFRKAANQLTDPDRSYDQWLADHPLARGQDYNLPVYPGARVSGERKSASCYEVVLITPDPADKVAAYYAQKLRGQLPAGEPSGRFEQTSSAYDATQWKIEDRGMGGRDTAGRQDWYVIGKRGALNRHVEIYRDPSSDGDTATQLRTYPVFSTEQRFVVDGKPLPGTGIALQSQELSEACVEIPPKAKWVAK